MIGKHNEWDIEAAFYIKELGTDPEKARIFVILRWMYHGDFRPLAAAIWEGGPGGNLDDAVLSLLAQLIDQGRVKLVPRKQGRTGRPKNPATLARRIVAGASYEADFPEMKSDERIEEISNVLGMSPQSVRNAVTAWKKRKRAKPSSATGPIIK
jgi:hypothetical protein